MWQNAENYPHYWWEHTNNALNGTAGDKLPATTILYAFLTLIYDFFMPYSPVTVTLYRVTATHNYLKHNIYLIALISRSVLPWKSFKNSTNKRMKSQLRPRKVSLHHRLIVGDEERVLFHFHSNLLLLIYNECIVQFNFKANMRELWRSVRVTVHTLFTKTTKIFHKHLILQNFFRNL